MDTRTRALIDFVQEKFGLDQYVLKTHQFYRQVTLFNETVYSLSMEWLPNHAAGSDEDLNPAGTAVAEIDVTTRKIKSIIFVEDHSFANGIGFDSRDHKAIINWVEKETGLTYGRHFQLEKEEKGHLYFYECIDGIKLFPPGDLEIQWDAAGRLLTFTNNTRHPDKTQIKKEVYALNLEKLGNLAKKQLSFFNAPMVEHEKMVPLYAVEETFVSNTEQEIIPYQSVLLEKPYIARNQVMFWEAPYAGKAFEEKEIQLTETITSEQAFSGEPSPDAQRMTLSEQERCVTSVQAFLSQKYPDDSGKWTLKQIYRDKGYIHAVLRRTQQSGFILQRKLVIFLDRLSLSVCNFIDNKLMIDSIMGFQPSAGRTLTKEQAYEKLAPLLELEPYYVCDRNAHQFMLCGKLDCRCGVDASNGKVFTLDAL
ncbi:hypothetical protein [Sporolactobacillus inulinus]|uniref:DUF4901 domain-containing protein n=1 Tax=Sporolactobacillus inulinus CASD TaxID=1069536 RepID=A0A0U1QNQ1_9BACL|nr:hypothetical protein [Sporolactobacillus inulinus]KLI02437.1 hypothetical protein SINU_08220 [Sporolactobacillus inulinus CASD]GEB76823.1 hypothetical protein SIN01_11680 [Sporolactobacillus inulinus]